VKLDGERPQVDVPQGDRLSDSTDGLFPPVNREVSEIVFELAQLFEECTRTGRLHSRAKHCVLGLAAGQAHALEVIQDLQAQRGQNQFQSQAAGLVESIQGALQRLQVMPDVAQPVRLLAGDDLDS
jgi:hypothetical protein